MSGRQVALERGLEGFQSHHPWKVTEETEEVGETDTADRPRVGGWRGTEKGAVLAPKAMA